MTTQTHPGEYGIEPDPHPIDWPDLVAKAERHGIPVLRLDDHGDMHLIRSVDQLRAEWED